MAEKKEDIQLSLSYEDTSNLIAGKSKIRKHELIKYGSRESYWAPLKAITERDGFNKRTDYGEIAAVAEWIKNHGNKLPEPMVLDVLTDDRIQIVRGHRRYRALLMLVSQKVINDDYMVEFFPNNTTVTEYQKMADQYLSNNAGKQFTPLEAAEVAYALKYNYGKKLKDEEVGVSMGLSRQTITNYILIASQTDDVKNEIRLAGMTLTAALDFIRDKKKHDKVADKKEEESHETSASASSPPQDALKKDMEDLEALEQTPGPEEPNDEEIRLAYENRERIEKERLEKIANHVEVKKEELEKHYNKRLAMPALRTWVEDFVDEDTGNVVSVDRSEAILSVETEINDETIQQLIEAGVEKVFIYKELIISPSVITEPVATPDKLKYDSERPEIAQIQNAIKLNDRLATRIAKLEISEGDKKDLLAWLEWQMKDLLEDREWIHNNKKQNKIR